MNAITRHGAATAKARALMGRLLSADDYAELILSKDIHGFVDYLVNQTVYREVFPEPERIVHRHEVEIGMRRNLFKHFEKFYHYYHDHYRTFFKILFMRYEIENLKLMIRAITRHEDIRHLGDHLVTSAIFSYVDYDHVLEARDISDFVDRLEGTPYHAALRPYVREAHVKMQFYMEMTLDRLYFKRIREILVHFDRRDKALMSELLGKNSDLLNLQWIYRAKRFYGVSPEEMLNYTLETGEKFDFRRLKTLCYLESADAIRAQVKDTEYSELFSDEDVLLERDMERYLFRLLDDLLKKGENSIIVPVVFMHKLEYEVRDLFTILECIKYQVADIERFMVRQLGGR